jgi:hypothetical protein
MSDTMQEPKTLEDALLDASTHYERVCTNCGQVWWGLHCPHDGYQNPCPNCDKKPTSVQELEHNTVCGCNGTLDLDEAEQSIQQLIKQARADQLKKLWNATQHDIVPEGTPPRDMSEELHKMIKELEE